MKSQAAMEYLMTYGWAILVIAVVLAALYSLGIFNPNTFAPKASAGSCEVVRPFGPTTTTDVHLEGTCTNMLPKYVAQFNGRSSKINVGSPTYLLSLNKTNAMTVILWFNLNQNVQQTFIATYSDEIRIGLNAPNTFIVDWGIHSDYTYTTPLITHAWYQVAISKTSDGTGTIYLNGNPIAVSTGLASTDIANNNPLLGIGYEIWQGTDFKYTNGSIANVQIYNTTLSANQISALYQEGIGGDPINPNHLVAWYPLNGNANDYSGNDYNGKAVNVGYSSTWYRTYSAP